MTTMRRLLADIGIGAVILILLGAAIWEAFLLFKPAIRSPQAVAAERQALQEVQNDPPAHIPLVPIEPAAPSDDVTDTDVPNTGSAVKEQIQLADIPPIARKQDMASPPSSSVVTLVPIKIVGSADATKAEKSPPSPALPTVMPLNPFKTPAPSPKAYAPITIATVRSLHPPESQPNKVEMLKPIPVTIAAVVPRLQPGVATAQPIQIATVAAQAAPASPLPPAPSSTVSAVMSLEQVQKNLPPPLEDQRDNAESAEGDSKRDDVRIVSGFEGCPAMEVRKISSTHFAVTLTSPDLQNWFMFRLEGAAGKTIRIDIHGERVLNWWSLNPVYSNIENLNDLDGFSSSDAKDDGKPSPAWNGSQLPDTQGQKWHYMQNVWMDSPAVLSFVQHFDTDKPYVAMRVPYTPGYDEIFASSLNHNSLIRVISIGKSKGGRTLRVLKVGAKDSLQAKNNPCVVLYAREHGTEQDASWAAEGAIRFLVSDTPEAAAIRNRYTFLIIPILDPDAAAASKYEGIINSFTVGTETLESCAYGQFFRMWAQAGYRLDMILDLHNVESSEAPHLSCPMFEMEPARLHKCEVFHEMVLRQMARNPIYHAAMQPWGKGSLGGRLGWWLSTYYGPLLMPYELNSQEQKRHLTVNETRDIGRALIIASTEYFATDDGRSLLIEIDAVRKAWSDRWNLYNSRLKQYDVVASEIMCKLMPKIAEREERGTPISH